MTLRQLLFAAIAVATPLLLLLTAASRPERNPSGVVLTQTPTSLEDLGIQARNGFSERYPTGSRVVHIAVPDSRQITAVLSGRLAAAGGPDVAPDRLSVVFTGRQDASSRWRVYRVGIDGTNRVPISPASSDCGDPAWIAGDRIVFTCAAAAPVGAWHLFVAAASGGPGEQISFGDGVASDPSPLVDGRLLFSLQPTPGGAGASGLFTINPDGTMLDSFAAHHDSGTRQWSARETLDGGVLFVSAGHGQTRLQRLESSLPSSTVTTIAAATTDGAGGAAAWGAVSPSGDDGFLVSARVTPGDRWQILRGMTAGGGLEPYLSFDDWDLTEAVDVAPRAAPRGRPSTVKRDKSNGILLCYDATRSDRRYGPDASSPVPSDVVLDEAGVELGRAPLADDGSFYLQVPADVSLRLRTLDNTGRTSATCSAPLWVRPGEVRACFGCHEGHEAAPRNRLPDAITRPPVVLAHKKDTL